MPTETHSFTSKGTKVRNQRGGKVASLGHFDPTTGKVYQHPRIKEQIQGSRVVVTNPAASTQARNQRTQSLGMGAAGQRGRNRDV